MIAAIIAGILALASTVTNAVVAGKAMSQAANEKAATEKGLNSMDAYNKQQLDAFNRYIDSTRDDPRTRGAGNATDASKGSDVDSKGSAVGEDSERLRENANNRKPQADRALKLAREKDIQAQVASESDATSKSEKQKLINNLSFA